MLAIRSRLLIFWLPITAAAVFLWLALAGIESAWEAPKNPPFVPKQTLRDGPIREQTPAGSPEQPAPSRALAATQTGVPAAFARFNEWTVAYLGADESEKARLISEGQALAVERRAALKQLMIEDPKQALDRALPVPTRQQMPPEIVHLLEARVNSRGFYGVLAEAPEAGAPALSNPYRREVRLADGSRFKAYTFGRRLNQTTTDQAYLNGISIDNTLALDDRPLRVLAVGELPDSNKPVVQTCPISKKSISIQNTESGLPVITSGVIAVEVGGVINYLCSGGHIVALEEHLVAEEGGTGGPVKPTGNVPGGWTTGTKSLLYLRVTFPDSFKEPLTEAVAYANMRATNDFFVESSFGNLYLLTTVAPLIVLPRTEAWYTSGTAGGGDEYDLRSDAIAIAKTLGYDTNQYDLDIVAYSGGPGSFGGLGYVGGRGVWLKSTSPGVTAHELGHNLGLWHSNFWNTNGTSVIGTGSNSEYGNIFDTMGSASAGDLHFSSFQKNKLNWLSTPTYVTTFVSNGIHRIYPMDQSQLDPAKKYALKIRKDGGRDYWAEFRQRSLSGNKWTKDGIILNWSAWNPSNGGPQLLDTTPGSPDDRSDAPLVIGRTFSDLEAGIHITPLGKAGTIPESMDVMVNVGAFTGNRPPTLAITASATAIPIATTIQLIANAGDLDNDDLSFYWEFGDKTFSTNNSPVVSKSWSSAGDYLVRCVASDMKGGSATRSVLITVGSPTTYRVSGQVTHLGQPLANVRVHNGLTGSSYAGTYSDTNGNFTIVGLNAATYSFAAALEGYNFSASGFNNPLTVSSHLSNVNFTGSLQTLVTLNVPDSDATEGAANPAKYTLTRTGSTAAALTVNLYYPSGSATYNFDYTLAPALTAPGSGEFYYKLIIPAGQASLDIALQAADDPSAEGPETATLTLVPGTGYQLGSQSNASVLIQDADSTLPVVSIQTPIPSASESGDSGRLIFSRTGATTAPLTVNFALSGTASVGADYSNPGAQLIIPAGQSSAQLSLNPLNDSAVEGLETIVVTLSADTAYLRPASSADYTGTINLIDDDMPQVTVTASDAAATEAPNNVGVFLITRTGDLSLPLTVNYALSGSAQHGVDYQPLPGFLTIPAGASAATVSIVPIDDGWGEPLQTVVLQLRSSLIYLVGSPALATVNLTDNNDIPAVTINLVDAVLAEPTDSGSFRITTTGSGTGNITVRYTVSGTATSGADFSALSGSVSVGRNATTDVTITPLDDSEIEGYESIIVTLSPDPTYSLLFENSVTLNLVDNDAPIVSASNTGANVSESSGTLSFWVSRTGVTTSALAVNYTLGGTATNGADYATLSGAAIIPAGASGVLVNAAVINDTLLEGTETVVLNLSAAGTYGLGIASATQYITDNESPATQVRFNNITGSGSEDAGLISIPVSLSAASAVPVTVEFGLNGGSATPDLDYTFSPGLLTFAPGETSKNISLRILDDNYLEPAQTVVIRLLNANGAALGTSTYTFTINDNDLAPLPEVNFSSISTSSLESVSAPQIYVALSAISNSPVTINYAITGGTAIAATDYTLSGTTLTFAPGETVKALPLSVINDSTVESNETIVFSISSPSGATLGTNVVHTLTVTDDDTASVTISATDANASESGSDPGRFSVARTGPTVSALTVNLNVAGSASNGSDYASIANTIVIAAGQSSININVVPIEDARVEGAETVQLSISPGGGYSAGTPNVATVTIADRTNTPPALSSISNLSYSSNPGTIPVAFTVSDLESAADSLVLVASSSNASLVPSTNLVLSGSGNNRTLSVTPVSGVYGVAILTITATDPANLSSAVSFNFSVSASNQAPTLDAIPTKSILEDAPLQTIGLTGISAGAVGEVQTLSITAVSNNPTLIANPTVVYQSPENTGSLKLQPAANRSGTAIIEVTINDGAGTNATLTRQFTVTVAAVNDAPSFTKGTDVSVNEDASAQLIVAWATGLSVGPSDESSQSPTFVLSNNNPSLFSSPPAIASDGSLSFTPAANAFGSATVTARLKDSGGTANGGVDLSGPQTFNITINAVNDAPSFTKGADQQVNESAGLKNVEGWASAISAGPGDENSQVLAFSLSTDNPSLFAQEPQLSADGTLTYRTASFANGSATVTVTLTDNGGTLRGGFDRSPSQTFKIVVLALNDPPSFRGGGDVAVAKNSTAQSRTWASEISAGPADEAAQNLHFELSVDHPELFSVAPSLTKDGVLTFSPLAGISGRARVTVVLKDDGGVADGGSDSSVEQSFNIALTTISDQSGVYYGLVRPPQSAGRQFTQTGSVRIAINRTGAFSGRLTVGREAFAIRGNFNDDGQSTFGRAKTETSTVVRKVAAPLLLDLEVDVAKESDQLTGRLTFDPDTFSEVEADRALYSAARLPIAPRRAVPLDLLGKYTLALRLNDSASNRPQGEGFGSLIVTRGGLARLAAYLPDGSRFSCSNPLSKTNRWPLHRSLNGGAGCINGWVYFRSNPEVSDFDGLGLHWFRPEIPTALRFPMGWKEGLPLNLIGSRYTALKPDGSPLIMESLGLVTLEGNTQLSLSATELPEALLKQFNLGPARLSVHPDFKFTLNAANGLFSGHLIDTSLQKHPFRGALLQKQNLGTGFFLTPTSTGLVDLHPQN